jgi:acetolactate synthase-1/2/3 large subunit
MRVADVLARTLRDAGITRMFGLPGGEILDFIDAARRAGIAFTLVRHEATASFMADALGQLDRRPAVCVSTLGPGAVNMTLGVANAFLDRSPVVAITASLATGARPFATHQNLDLEAIYRPFTKSTMTLDGTDTAARTIGALRTAMAPRMGPVHLALPSDVARREDLDSGATEAMTLDAPPPPPPSPDAVRRMGARLASSRRPIVLLGLDLDPSTAAAPVRRFVDAFGAPVFVTPKAKGILPEDHPLFCGVCAGVAGDGVIVDFLGSADLLVGLGFDPVESDKIWHQTLGMVSIGPLSIAAGDFAPRFELVADVGQSVDALLALPLERSAWEAGDIAAFKATLTRALEPPAPPAGGVSPYEATRLIRRRCPRETVATTDVGSVKFVVSQAWTTWEPLMFLESNGLSAMGYALPAAMAAKLRFPDRPVVCTVGDGGFGMMMADVETCVRERLDVVTVVFNDSALSLIQVAQARRGHPDYGVRYGTVDFAAVAAGLGAWSRRVSTLNALERAIDAALESKRPAVIDMVVDTTEYHTHAARPRHE